jgi:2,4-diaminopentanoate dehydrogenase
MNETKVTLLGVGRVGRDVAALLCRRPGVEIVSAWSRNPAHAGVDLGELASGERMGVAVSSSLDEALRHRGEIALIATTSFLRDLAPQIQAAVESGHNVICTGEETAYPWAVDAELADRLDGAARAKDVTVLGAGVNPGFIFDALTVTLTGVAHTVDRIRVSRVVDVSHFSATVLGRLGIGYTLDEFEQGRASGAIKGHIGFPQTIHVVANALGRSVERIEGTVDPLIADRHFSADHLDVPPERTAGFVQHYTGVVEGRDWFHASLTGHVAPAASGIAERDTIEIEGAQPLALAIDPALQAQPSVAALLANSITRVVAAPPGWLTVTDLPPARPPAPRVAG